MSKVFKYLIPVLLFVSCSESTGTEETAASKQVESIKDDVKSKDRLEEAREWLKDAITNYLGEEVGDGKLILTQRMHEYWMDQIKTVYGDLTMDEFHDKWESIYDVERSTRDNGLFIDAQDYGMMRILSCEEINPNDEGYCFLVHLRDELFEQEYTREITLVLENDSFLIDEVRMML